MLFPYYFAFHDHERLDELQIGWRSFIFRVYMYGVQRGDN